MSAKNRQGQKVNLQVPKDNHVSKVNRQGHYVNPNTLKDNYVSNANKENNVGCQAHKARYSTADKSKSDSARAPVNEWCSKMVYTTEIEHMSVETLIDFCTWHMWYRMKSPLPESFQQARQIDRPCFMKYMKEHLSRRFRCYSVLRHQPIVDPAIQYDLLFFQMVLPLRT